MDTGDHVVYVVDDDVLVRDALQELLLSAGIHGVLLPSVAAYVRCPKPNLPSCLVLDVVLPEINGLEFQAQMTGSYHPPIVFITGRGDIPSTVQAIKAGAVDFLQKPFSDRALLRAIRAALVMDGQARQVDAEMSVLQGRFGSLTRREQDVLPLIVSGLLNKQAAARLGISETTLQIHRGKIMQKMAAESLPDLVRMASKLDVPIAGSRRRPDRAQPQPLIDGQSQM